MRVKNKRTEIRVSPYPTPTDKTNSPPTESRASEGNITIINELSIKPTEETPTIPEKGKKSIMDEIIIKPTGQTETIPENSLPETSKLKKTLQDIKKALRIQEMEHKIQKTASQIQEVEHNEKKFNLEMQIIRLIHKNHDRDKECLKKRFRVDLRLLEMEKERKLKNMLC